MKGYWSLSNIFLHNYRKYIVARCALIVLIKDAWVVIMLRFHVYGQSLRITTLSRFADNQHESARDCLNRHLQWSCPIMTIALCPRPCRVTCLREFFGSLADSSAWAFCSVNKQWELSISMKVSMGFVTLSLLALRLLSIMVWHNREYIVAWCEATVFITDAACLVQQFAWADISFGWMVFDAKFVDFDA